MQAVHFQAYLLSSLQEDGQRSIEPMPTRMHLPAATALNIRRQWGQCNHQDYSFHAPTTLKTVISWLSQMHCWSNAPDRRPWNYYTNAAPTKPWRHSVKTASRLTGYTDLRRPLTAGRSCVESSGSMRKNRFEWLSFTFDPTMKIISKSKRRRGVILV